jgi:hypothetical protein
VTDRERAIDYIAIFINADACWEFYAPLDATKTARGIRLGTVEIEPDPDKPGVWLLKDGDQITRYRKAEPTEVPA